MMSNPKNISKMKKLFFALVALFMTISASAQFQGGGMRQMNPEDMAKRQADQIKETCKTNDEQYKKLYDYFLGESKAQVARMDSIRKAMEAGGQQAQPGQRGGWNREDMQKRQEAQLKVLKGILTEEQMAAYTKAQEERRARMGQRGQGQGGQGFGGQRRQREQQ